jgi:superfamily I DNA and/or RNA helicase
MGFLKTKNRVNILLSRTKKGMYLIGNAATLGTNEKSKTWPEILKLIEKEIVWSSTP